MILNFGKYRGRSTEEVYQDDPVYVDWVMNTVSENPYFRAAQQAFKKHREEAGWQESEARSQTLPWFEVLEVSPDAPMEDIRKAFKRQMRLYHPDKVDGLGVELRELATRKTQAINAAYDRAQKERE
jgi:DnaJ like chaperone protein